MEIRLVTKRWSSDKSGGNNLSSERNQPHSSGNYDATPSSTPHPLVNDGKDAAAFPDLINFRIRAASPGNECLPSPNEPPLGKEGPPVNDLFGGPRFGMVRF
ncbi:hypothetical protein CEXT_697311 [Caerostris extrusa]|uniref:Uncharacterized protein n=1 Tax=Caerostris extrusa TaxID=172846 RepID=A0AAV4YG13_CAEEX|nr:hypothetical protein CEXT_697311 [Caerostris extrusa]